MKLYSNIVLAGLAAIALQACSSSEAVEPQPAPAPQCQEAYWKEQAEMYKTKSENWYNQAQMLEEKNKRMQDEYNSCFRK